MKIGKKLCLLAFALSLAFLTVTAQDKYRFGEIPEQDLSMTVYPEDTTAVAVVLYENCEVNYEIRNDDFSLITKYTARVKVLKSAGLDQANVVIPFYVAKSRENSESVYNISGYTYNNVGGKTERTKLSKEYIFEEKTSENWQRMKVTFPNVKVGSVFEIKYEKLSPYYRYLDDFAFQSSIPVRYSRYQVTIPEYFKFHKRTSGYERLDYSEENVNVSLVLGSGKRLTCLGQKMTFVAKSLPALKDDNYVWNKNDYTSKLTFDLSGVEIPGAVYKDFTATWQNIDEELMDSESFGRKLRYSNLMKDELPTVLKDSMLASQKVSALLNLIKEKIQWNEDNSLYIDNVKKAIKEGKGSSAEMNAALICVLRDAGFEAYPVVLSLRSHGRIFSAFPTMKSLNYFLVGVDVDGKQVFMDASDKYGTVNVLPADCMVQEARCVFKDRPGKWVDLHHLGRNGYMTNIIAKFNEDGKLSGTVQEIRNGVPCTDYCRKVDKQKSVDDYKAALETDLNVIISDLVQGKPQDVTVMEKFSYKNDELTLEDDHIYINSLVFPYIKENPFKAETRKLPVEFPYPYDHIISTILIIPEGYEVEEIPVAEKITLGDKQINYSYLTQKGTDNVQIVQRLSIRETIYPVTEYEHVRDFWARIANKNSAQIVLKRKAQ